MSTQLEQLSLQNEVDRIVEALFTLPADKVTEVRDYVWFLQTQYGQPTLMSATRGARRTWQISRWQT